MFLIDFILSMMSPAELNSGRIEIWSGFEDEAQRYVGF